MEEFLHLNPQKIDAQKDVRLGISLRGLKCKICGAIGSKGKL